MVDPVISLDGLGKRFGHTVAVNGISMAIGEGEIFGFLGANGAGKTTTIRMLCGLTRSTRGHGTIHGLDIWADRSRVRPQFGYVPQRFSLYADLTVLENLRFFGCAYRVSGDRLRTRIETLLSELDLATNRDTEAGRLSGGFKQLLSISCALIHEPSVLFLDEPTAGLDPVHRQYIWGLLYKLSRQGTTIFLTTHYMDEAARCTDIGFISGWTAYSKRFSTRAETRFAEQASGNSCERSYGWDADAPWDSRCLRSRVAQRPLANPCTRFGGAAEELARAVAL